MARAAKATRTTKSTATARKLGRPAKVAKKSSGKATKSSVAPRNVVATRPVAAAAAPAPKLSKEELRAQVEKLERANAALRAKSREINKMAKTAAARTAELEDRVAQLEKDAAAAPAPRTSNPKPKSPASNRSERQSESVDPGDAPPGVAVEQPGSLDDDARTALQNLEEHLGDA